MEYRAWSMGGAGARLLVSVRDAAEAGAALAGGADVVDVKEPVAGPLGRPRPQVIDEVLARVEGRCPVTVAMGELGEAERMAAPPGGVALAKCGLAATGADWQRRLAQVADRVGRRRFVAAAYADAQRVDAPDVTSVIDWALSRRVAGVLVDTAIKDGQGLWAWYEVPTLAHRARRLRSAGLFLALAGSVRLEEVGSCVAAGADVVAVRGAACAGGVRDGAIDSTRVRELAHAVRQAGSCTPAPASAGTGGD